ncbi:MAG: hypothetical protein CSYNP_01537 [Syntrophus sp. SKADARSKE-3]|nr:hypothetical protein [Syntrophus sp. SKADARSKE-3]
MDLNGVSEGIVLAGYGIQPPPVSRPPQKVAAPQITAAAAMQEQQEQQALSRERMQKMVEDIQTNLSHLDVGISFSTYGPKNDQVSITLTEKATGRVIREIPSKDLQSLYTKMEELVGMVLSRKA